MLSHHHPWIIQKAAGLGMKALPTRAHFFDQLTKQESAIHKREYSVAEALKDQETMINLCSKLSAHLWDIFAQRGLTEI
jgi:hypothetical protein